MQLLVANHEKRQADVITLDIEGDMKKYPQDDAEFGKLMRELINKAITHVK